MELVFNHFETAFIKPSIYGYGENHYKMTFFIDCSDNVILCPVHVGDFKDQIVISGLNIERRNLRILGFKDAMYDVAYLKLQDGNTVLGDIHMGREDYLKLQAALLKDGKTRVYKNIELGLSLQQPWDNWPDLWQQVEVFTQKYMYPYFCNLEQLGKLEDALICDVWSKSREETGVLGVLQCNYERNPHSYFDHQKSAAVSFINDTFSVFANMISDQLGEKGKLFSGKPELTSFIYGAMVGAMKNACQRKCELEFNIHLEESFSFDECMQTYVKTMNRQMMDDKYLIPFAWYLMKLNKIVKPEEDETVISHGFEYALQYVAEKLAPYKTHADEEWRRQEISESLSFTAPVTASNTDIVVAESSTQKERYRNMNCSEIDVMTGIQFESFVAWIFEAMGYTISLTPKTCDQGLDLVVSRGGSKIGVQTKRYNSTVGNSAIQEAVAGKAFYKVDSVVVVTNSHYTKAAMKLAEANGVKLWDRETLHKMFESAKEITDI